MQSCFEVHEKIPNYMEYKDDDTSTFGSGEDMATMFGSIYNKLCNICVNKDLKDNYGLMAKTNIVHCVDKINQGPFDLVDKGFLAVFLLIVLMIASATLYERKKNNPKVASIFERLSRTKKWLKAFSIKDNWRKLTDDTYHDLGDVACLHALKIVILFLFIFSQVYRHIVGSPFANPITVEEVSDEHGFE